MALSTGGRTISPTTGRAQVAALALATLAFAVNFWAWALLSPLAPTYEDLLDLTPTAVSILVGVPVIIGSLGRITLGALTDRYGGRVMFVAATLIGIAPAVFLAFADNYPALLAGGFVLGITGATFAIGIPFVNAWFPPERRGLALGVFGMGNIGTAISGFATPRIADAFGRPAAFLTVAMALALVGLLFALFGRDAPGSRHAAAEQSFLARLSAAARLRTTQELAVTTGAAPVRRAAVGNRPAVSRE